MYNASDACLNAQISTNTNMDRIVKIINSIIVISSHAFKGSILILHVYEHEVVGR